MPENAAKAEAPNRFTETVKRALREGAVILTGVAALMLFAALLSYRPSDPGFSFTGTGDAEIVAAPGAGLAIYVTSVMCGNTSGTLTRVDIKEGSTARISQPLAASGGGFSRDYDPPWQLPANTALNGALGTAVS